jgi:hypothetical protein
MGGSWRRQGGRTSRVRASQRTPKASKHGGMADALGHSEWPQLLRRRTTALRRRTTAVVPPHPRYLELDPELGGSTGLAKRGSAQEGKERGRGALRGRGSQLSLMRSWPRRRRGYRLCCQRPRCKSLGGAQSKRSCGRRLALRNEKGASEA